MLCCGVWQCAAHSVSLQSAAVCCESGVPAAASSRCAVLCCCVKPCGKSLRANALYCDVLHYIKYSVSFKVVLRYGHGYACFAVLYCVTCDDGHLARVL
jgi:hypothetical protein